MENATKALLIAAAVLIAIVLIALGVSLLKAGGDTSDKAGEVGSVLKDEAESAATKVEGLLGGKTGLTKNDITDVFDQLQKDGYISDNVILETLKKLNETECKVKYMDFTNNPMDILEIPKESFSVDEMESFLNGKIISQLDIAENNTVLFLTISSKKS